MDKEGGADSDTDRSADGDTASGTDGGAGGGDTDIPGVSNILGFFFSIDHA